MCENLNIKLIYGTPYIHTATGLVERGIKTLKDLMRTNLEDNCNLNVALHRSLMVMRTTIHSKIKQSPFERNYGRKPRTELTSYLNLPTDNIEFIPAQSETLQVYSFNNGRGGYDQLIMKTPRKLKCDVCNNFPYKFMEKKTKKNKFESGYQSEPQTAVAGTKHTITTDTNRILQRKLVSKPLPNSFRTHFPVGEKQERDRCAIYPDVSAPTGNRRHGRRRNRNRRRRERKYSSKGDISRTDGRKFRSDPNNTDRTRKAKTR